MNNRQTTLEQGKLAEKMIDSPRVLQQRALSDAIQNSPRILAQRHEINALHGGAMSAELSPVQRKEKPNHTGLPDQLKSGIETLSGMSMDHVKVHYNSDKPAQLQAHAYAQGGEIHLAPGQEQHLPHEAWHVVQQAQGRVKPTMQMKAGVGVNDDAGLEAEADLMGARALSGSNAEFLSRAPAQRRSLTKHMPVYQLVSFYHGGAKAFVDTAIKNPHQAKTSAGELGSAGMYYWKNDENAALFTAITYNESSDWAVMKIDINDDITTESQKNTRFLVFKGPYKMPEVHYKNEKPKTISGMHYRFLQDNLDIKFATPKIDIPVEGELDDQYLGLTGREFLDTFDVVISPTKADDYKHQVSQVRANDKGLTNFIYGEKENKKNSFSKTWEGRLDKEKTKSIANMKFEKRHDVPAFISGLEGVTKF